jgi:CheY-like chemotaxis protein
MNRLSGHRILFVDDNFICNLETREFLQAQGMAVAAAYCGAAALQMIDRGDRLSALVTDIDLGDGPDGFQIARRARAVYPGLPVVFISGLMGGRVPAEGVVGAAFVSKPFHPSQVAAALDRVIDGEAAYLHPGSALGAFALGPFALAGRDLDAANALTVHG